jgi:hypothetical protein
MSGAGRAACAGARKTPPPPPPPPPPSGAKAARPRTALSPDPGVAKARAEPTRPACAM